MLKKVNVQVTTIYIDRVGFGKNNWYIQKSLIACRDLRPEENPSYKVQAFSCSCNNHHGYITRDQTKVPYRCSKCHNTYFFDSGNYLNQYTNFLLNLDNHITLSLDDTYAYAKAYINVPNNINLSTYNIGYDKQLVYVLKIYLQGGEESHREKYALSLDVKRNIYHQLLIFIEREYLQHKVENYLINTHNQTHPQLRKKIKFFLEYPNVANVKEMAV